MTDTTPPALTRRGMLLTTAALTAAVAAASPRPAGAQNVAVINSMVARANGGTVGVIAGGVEGTYIRIAADLASVLDDGDALRVLPMIGKGSVQNILDIMLLRGVDIGIVQSDALTFARNQRLVPGIDSMIQYIAKLYDEEIHVLAREDIRSLEDLTGKIVNIDLAGSGTAMTASLVFDMLGIKPEVQQETQDVALTRLRAGEIAALVFVAGKPARLFSNLPPGTGLHFLPIPITEALIETYLPSPLAATDYPNLIPPEATIETIAVGAVMAVYAWQPGSERYRKVSRFVEALHARFPAFLQPPRHPKWKDVNLAALVPGWTRFNPGSASAR